MNQDYCRRAAAMLSITLLSALVAACGGGGGGDSSVATTIPVASPPPAASAPVPSSPASVASAGLFVPSWALTTCDQTSGDLSIDEPNLPVATTGKDTTPALFGKLNAARAAMCAGYLTLDPAGTLTAEARGRTNQALASKVASPGFSTFGGYAVPTGWDGATFDPAVDALDSNGLEIVQSAPMRVASGGFTVQSPQHRIAAFGLVQESDARFLMSSLHDTPLAVAQRCTNELLSQPAQRERLLDPRFRLVGVASGSMLPRYFAAEDQLSDVTDAICFATTASTLATYEPAGLASAPSGWVGIWPPQGSYVPFVDVHARGATDGSRHGYPASVAIDSSLVLTVQSFTIRDAEGNLVPSTIGLDALPDAMFQNWAFVTPIAPLALNTQYTVHFRGSANGVDIDKIWTFSTPVALTAFDPRND